MTQDAIAQVKSELLKQDPESNIVIVVRPFEGPPLKPLDPKLFVTPLDYRKTLIERNQARNKPGIDAVSAVAADCGLQTVPFSTLNALSVSGKVSDILDFLDKAPIATAILNAPVQTNLPKPKGPKF